MGGGKVKKQGQKAVGVEEWKRKSNAILPTGKLRNRGMRQKRELVKEEEREDGRSIFGGATKGAHPPEGGASSQPLFNVFN